MNREEVKNTMDGIIKDIKATVEEVYNAREESSAALIAACQAYQDDEDSRLDKISARISSLRDQLLEAERKASAAQLFAAQATVDDDQERFEKAQELCISMAAECNATTDLIRRMENEPAPKNKELFSTVSDEMERYDDFQKKLDTLCSQMAVELYQAIDRMQALIKEINAKSRAVKMPGRVYDAALKRFNSPGVGAREAINELGKRRLEDRRSAEAHARQMAQLAGAEAKAKAQAEADSKPAPYRTIYGPKGMLRQRWDEAEGRYIDDYAGPRYPKFKPQSKHKDEPNSQAAKLTGTSASGAGPR